MAVALLPVAHVCEPYAVAPAAPALAHRPVAVESAPLAEVQVTGLTGLRLVLLNVLPCVLTVPLGLALPITGSPTALPALVAALTASTSGATEVDSEPTVLLVESRPVLNEDTPVLRLEMPVEVEVLSEETPVLKLEMPVEVEVDSEDTPVDKLLTPVLNEDTPVLNEDTPVLNEDTPVLRLEMPVEVEVLSEDTPVDKLLTPVLRLLTLLVVVERPVLTEVDSEPTVLLVVDRPVLRLLILLVAVDRPVDVDVLREETVLLVVDRPVLRLEMPVEVEVDSEPIFVSSAVVTLYSWLPLMALVEVAETSPSATPWICRLPTATTPLVGAWFTVNVEPETTPLAVVQLVVAVTAAATEPLPSATELASETLVLRPRANPSTALTVALAPSA